MFRKNSEIQASEREKIRLSTIKSIKKMKVKKLTDYLPKKVYSNIVSDRLFEMTDPFMYMS